MTNRLYQTHALAGVVILAGGASSRMGTPKATLRLPTGDSLLDYHVRQAAKLNVPIMIADNGRGFKVCPALLLNSVHSSVSHIADYSATASAENGDSVKETGGALVAILSALQSIADLTDASTLENKHLSWLMVMSCDSLIPATALWQQLQTDIAPALNQSVICLSDDTHVYPLLGLYRLSIAADLKAYIERGERQVMRFIQSKVHTVCLPKTWQYLTNFNTPKDFNQACTALNDG